jgi:hypothetical protein
VARCLDRRLHYRNALNRWKVCARPLSWKERRWLVLRAAGSLIVLLLWVYYSSQILFFGAEFTQVYANRFGSHVTPADNAVAVPKHA